MRLLVLFLLFLSLTACDLPSNRSATVHCNEHSIHVSNVLLDSHDVGFIYTTPDNKDHFCSSGTVDFD